MKRLKDVQKHTDLIIELLNAVPFNTLFAESVINQTINGEIFVDNIKSPRTFYILHPYGMSLLLGENCHDFEWELYGYVQNSDKKRNKTEWMQAYPDHWHAALNKMVNKNANKQIQLIEIDVRVNFKFNLAKYIELNPGCVDEHIEIKRTSADDFESMSGSVIPKYFWNTQNDFINKGVGYSVFYKNTLASIAFSSVVNSSYLELGIKTKEPFRGRNFAYMACCALLNYCLEKGLEPVWACRKSNIGSYKLAEKLGFEESLNTPYYKLNY